MPRLTPTVDDLRVYRRDAVILEVHSHLTRGRCATVYKFDFSDNYSIVPYLIPSYMQGIDICLMMEAVRRFVAKENFQRLIVEELINHGWFVDPRDNTNVVIARRSVKTFRGIDFAKVHPIIVFEDGGVAVRAEFISKGQNALALCTAYIKTSVEIPAKIADFNAEVLEHLSQAFSVRIAA